MKMKPVRPINEHCMTILGPYRSAAQPLSCMMVSDVRAGKGTGRKDAYKETKDTTSGRTITESGLPVGWNGISNLGGRCLNTEPSQERRYQVSTA